MAKLLLLTPPFTQLNTPYPATAYIKGFLNTLGVSARQADLGIEVTLKLFSKEGLEELFALLEDSDVALSANAYRVYSLRAYYLQTIDPVIQFLQHKDPTLAHNICGRGYLPEAKRFEQLEKMDWAFGQMGTQDKARHLATLYLEDLGDLIKEAIDPHFGFSRYAERLGRTASSFDELEASLNEEDSFISTLMLECLETHIQVAKPELVCLSVPFPGNLFGAFKAGQYLKAHYPEIKIALGGGFANTELRSLADERVFEYLDFVCLDDGELPLQCLLEYLDGKREQAQLKRTFVLKHGVVQYINGAEEKDIPQREVGTPDYSDLLIKDYLSVIEVANPMHRLWSDGRWNKLTLAHGCYWGKCSFCDVSLDYIQRYEPIDASILCDRIEQIIEQTGERGFHFVDEAAPPALMRDLAIEILRRGLTISWWTNIRFEKSFTPDLCRLLKASGCIAVSGGLEVASDRLLDLMKKGVTVAQVARVADAFRQADIMVHAYLMYGFPTQTEQETIDSLEMVRQLFEQGVLQSGFWHRFAMTAHSPVGLNPEAYKVEMVGPDFDGFAENDYYHEDPLGAEHDDFSEGLRVSLFNYMHGIGLDFELQEWFEVEVPETSIPSDFIANALMEQKITQPKASSKLLWLGPLPELDFFEEEGEEFALLSIYQKRAGWEVELSADLGAFLMELISEIHPQSQNSIDFRSFQAAFEEADLGQFSQFVQSKFFEQLRVYGLLLL
jgi:hypothetical protein